MFFCENVKTKTFRPFGVSIENKMFIASNKVKKHKRPKMYFQYYC